MQIKMFFYIKHQLYIDIFQIKPYSGKKLCKIC